MATSLRIGVPPRSVKGLSLDALNLKDWTTGPTATREVSGELAYRGSGRLEDTPKPPKSSANPGVGDKSTEIA